MSELERYRLQLAIEAVTNAIKNPIPGQETGLLHALFLLNRIRIGDGQI
jgi:hypothetical protein